MFVGSFGFAQIVIGKTCNYYDNAFSTGSYTVQGATNAEVAHDLRRAIVCANDNSTADTILLSQDISYIDKFSTDADGPNALPSIISEITIKSDIAGTPRTIERDASLRRSTTNACNTDLTKNFRIFHVASGGDLTLEDLVIQNGCADGPSTSGEQGGGLYNEGMVAITNSTISSNDGAVGGGGGFYNSGTITVTNSTISDNSGGFYTSDSGTTTVTNSTISGNSSPAFGGFRNLGTTTVTNSTISGNSAFFSGGFFNSGTTTVTNSTISGNGHDGFHNSGTITVNNSIVADNTDSNCSGTGTVSGQNNFTDDMSCITFVNAGFTQSVTLDLDLGSLQDNGGPTETIALGSNSVAIGGGDKQWLDEAIVGVDLNGDGDQTDDLSTGFDQRGAGFPRIQDGLLDVGAFETPFRSICGSYTFPYTVGTANTDLAADLRRAIICANANSTTDTISLPNNITYSDFYTNTDGPNALPSIISEITIKSDIAGTPRTIERDASLRRSTTNACNTDLTKNFRIFHVASGGDLTLEDLVIQNGCADGPSTSGEQGGGLYNEGMVAITNSTISSNDGAVGGGGGFYNSGTITVTNSTISDNSGGFYTSDSGTTTVTNSTISGNSSPAFGGFRNLGTTTVTNSTISGNSAFFSGGFFNSGTTTVTNSTISGNGHDGFHNSGTITVNNSIVADNTDSNCSGTGTVSGQNNFTDDISCTVFANADFTESANLDLGSLQDNGGPTETIALGSNSVAIGGGDKQWLDEAIVGVDLNGDGDQTDDLSTGFDQRGAGFPRIQDGILDAGAVQTSICVPYTFPYTVGTVNTDLAADLRRAITCANANSTADTISLPNNITYSDFYTSTDGQNALSSITSEITIKSNVAGTPRTIERDASLRRSTTNACNTDLTKNFRIFHVASGGDLTLEDLVIQNGCADGPSTSGEQGGGLYNEGMVAITNSTISSNDGAVGGGGGFYNSGTITVTNSTISDNSGGFYTSDSGTTTVTNSTISGNSSPAFGGFRNLGTTTVTNSTISGNSAFFSGGFFNSGTTTVTNSTISGNGHDGFHNSGTITVNNSIVADNTDSNCSGTGTVSGQNNFTDDISCTVFANADFTESANLDLGSLQDNGGPTETIALGSNSVAIGGGDKQWLDEAIVGVDLNGDGDQTDDLSTGFDQRGAGFPRIQDGILDAGAVQTSICVPYTFPYTVGTVNTDLAADLRRAITCANANSTADTISLPNNITYSDFYTSTDGQNALSSITSEITIKSNVAGTPRTIERDASLRRSTTNACNTDLTKNFRIFHVVSGGNLTLEDLIIQNGCANANVPSALGEQGGGLYNDGMVTVINSTISDNSALVGGGFYNLGTTTVTNSTISDNSGFIRGGGFYNLGTTTVTNSTISGNSTDAGGGFYNLGTTTVINSTISDNSGGDDGGGFLNSNGTTTVTNSTISGNSATFSGGFLNSNGTTTVTNSTISGNSATGGGGSSGFNNDSGTTAVNNSIVADNTGFDCSNTGTVSGQNNFTDDISCTVFANADFIQSANLDLGNLQDNGGPTETIALGSNSVAIGGGDKQWLDEAIVGVDLNGDGDKTDDLSTGFDQRGAGFPRIQDGLLDVGAVETPSICGPYTFPYTVGTVNTDLATDLRQAIICANANSTADTILLPQDISYLDKFITDTAGQNALPSITSEITIKSNVAGTPHIIERDASLRASPTDACNINLNQNFRIFHVASGGNLILEDLVIQNGCANGPSTSGEQGGSLYNDGMVTVINSTISSNSAGGDGGGFFSTGTTTVTNSTISGNSTFDDGGGFFSTGTTTVTNSNINGNSAADLGGGFLNDLGTTTIINSTISGNAADFGGGLLNDRGTTTVTNSTISDNSASEGGGFYNFEDTTIVTNSTISGNAASEGGGFYNANGTTTVTNSTISGNSATSGGSGGFNNGSGTITVNNSIVADNTDINCSGTGTVSGQNNFTDDISCTVFANADFTESANLDLGSLQDNGGPTKTIALGSSSAAINGGDKQWLDEVIVGVDLNGDGDKTDDLSTGFDQRGAGFPRIKDGLLDAGAYEEGLIAETEITLDTSNNLIITDINGGNSDDTLTIQSDTTNSQFIITDTNGLVITTSIAGATGDLTSTITIPFSAVNGSEITINALAGNDTLTVDFSLGDFSKTITYNGGDPTTGSGDSLNLTGGTPTSVIHSFTNAGDGSVDIDGQIINYTGLEPVIDSFTVANRGFSFTGGAETITLSDDGTASDSVSFIDSTLGESITFTDPTDSLTINTSTNGGSGADTINIKGLDSTFDANLIINGDDDDTINFQTNSTDTKTGNLTANAIAVNITSPVASTSGNIEINTDNIDIANPITSTGNLTIQPRTASTSIGIGGGAGTLNLTDSELGNLTDGFNLITIGSSTAGAVEIDSASFTDPVTIIGTIIKETGTSPHINNPDNLTTLIGEVTPGASPGQLVVNGSLTFDSTNTYTVEINGATTAGTDYDQIQVTGANRIVTLNNSTLNASIGGGYTPSSGDEIVIIDNVEASSSVSGIFNGLNEGDTLTITGTIFTISYAAGTDNNDVLLTPTSSPTNLIVSINDSAVIESAGAAATTATITRFGNTGDLTVNLTSDDTTEVTVLATATIPDGQTSTQIDIDAVDDNLIDGTQTVTITASAAGYQNGTDTLDVTDDDAAGFTITETNGDTTVSETGTTDTFDVVLNTQPASNVVITVTSEDTGEATVDKATLTFTPTNWNTTQTVTVTGVDDTAQDGDQTTTITISIDDANSNDVFDPLADQTVTVTTIDDDIAGFKTTESGGDTTVSETGMTDTFDVVLNTQPASNVVITVTSGDTGEATVDKATLTFTPTNWNTTQTVTVTGVDDAIDDGDQTTTVTLSVDDANSDNNFDPLADQTVTVTTIDDDSAGFTVTETGTGTTVSETGTTDTFDVVLNTQPASNVVITVTSGDAGEATVDKATLTFTPINWNTTQTVTVTGVDDTAQDGDQTTTITLSIDDTNSDDNFDPLAGQTVIVTTIDDDSAGFTVIETGTGTTVSEAGMTDTFEVVLNSQPISNVVINISNNDTSETSVDKGVLTFAPTNWDKPQIVTVIGIKDNIIDGNQLAHITLMVNGSNSDSNFASLPNQQVKVTNIDSDSATLEIEDVTVLEGDSGVTQAKIDITLQIAVNGGFTIDYATTDGEAKLADRDYQQGSGQLTFNGAAGEVKTIIVEVNGDTKVEPNETLLINLNNVSSNKVKLANSQSVVTIENDDVATLSINDVSQAEGNKGTTDFIFTVSLDKEVDTAFELDFATVDKTALNNDYNANTGKLNFAGNKGETQTITVEVIGDELVEPDEDFLINLTNLNTNGRNISLTDDQGIGTIQNDDFASLSIDDVSLLEGNSGDTTQAVFTVSLIGELVGGFNVDFDTENNTAEDEDGDGDYQSTNGILNFAGENGETKTISIDIVGDNKGELDETFFVNLSSTNPNLNIVDNQGQGIIVNDDTATISIDDISLNEGNEGTTLFTFTVSLDNEVDTGFTVDFTTADDTGTVGDNDYNLNTNTLNFAGTAGETQTITVEVIGDTNIEPDEQFLVNLTNLTGSGRNINLANTQGIGTIINDDVAILNIDDVTMLEGNSSKTTQAVFTVSLISEVIGGFSVDFSTQDDTAEDENGDSDYQSTSGTLNFVGTDGETQIITINITGDNKVEANENFFVNLQDISTNAVQIAKGQGLGTITNDDTAQLSIDDVSIFENGDSQLSSTQTDVTELVFTISLSGEVAGGFTVDYATEDGTAEDENGDGDYKSNSGTLTFAGTDGETKTINIEIFDDEQDETDESFFVNLSNVSTSNIPANSVELTKTRGVATIRNDDQSSPLTILLQKEVAQNNIEIGQKVEYRVIVTNPNDNETLTVTIKDTPPTHTSYVENSASPSEPTLTDGDLVWTNIVIDPDSSLIISYELQIIAGAEGELVNSVTAEAESNLGRTTQASAKVAAEVRQGIFSREKGLLTGRVYIDQDSNGSYNANIDKVVTGARVIMSNGWQVETDIFGNYSFRNLESGIWTVQLDANTVNTTPAEHPEALGDGYMHRVLVQGIAVSDFVLEPNQSYNLVATSVGKVFIIGSLTIEKQITPLVEGVQVELSLSTTEALEGLVVIDPVPIENEQDRMFELGLFEGSTTLSYELPITVPLTQPNANWSQQ